MSRPTIDQFKKKLNDMLPGEVVRYDSQDPWHDIAWVVTLSDNILAGVGSDGESVYIGAKGKRNDNPLIRRT